MEHAADTAEPAAVDHCFPSPTENIFIPLCVYRHRAYRLMVILCIVYPYLQKLPTVSFLQTIGWIEWLRQHHSVETVSNAAPIQYHHVILFQPLPGMKLRRKMGRGEKKRLWTGEKGKEKKNEGGENSPKPERPLFYRKFELWASVTTFRRQSGVDLTCESRSVKISVYTPNFIWNWLFSCPKWAKIPPKYR